MSCQQCTRGPKHHPSFNHSLNYGSQYYSDVSPECGEVEEEDEPVAPTLSLGNRILWLTEAFAASGIVRWIGRIPSISHNWTAGVEFDNVMPNGGDGSFHNRCFFNSRPGHSLFLPVSELIKVDDPSNERTSFFGRLQDSCSNFAQRRKRDSTFGHFKQEGYSTCAQNEFHCNGHYYGHAPVYDRITSRRSLRYDDHPYETYNTCVPCGTLPLNGTSQNVRHQIQSRVRNDRFQAQPNERLHCINDELDDRIQHAGYLEEGRFDRKDSFFQPRSSLKLISGFKEWVTCLLQGTGRRKPKRNKIILKDRKSVTSVFLQSLTGQRLSSFSEYATVSVSGVQQTGPQVLDSTEELQKRGGSQRTTRLAAASQVAEPSQQARATQKTKEPSGLLETQEPLDFSDEPFQQRKKIGSQKTTRLEYSTTSNQESKSSGLVKKSQNESGNSLKTSSHRKRLSKKRPAPLPPMQKQEPTIEVIRNDCQKFVSTKTVKSTSLVSHSVPLKKKYKKKRAPLPPAQSTIYASVHKKERKSVQEGSSNYDNLHFSSARQRHNAIVLQDNQNHCDKHKRRPIHRQLRRMPDISSLISSNKTLGSQDSSSGDISFSPDDDSEDEKYGLVKYRMGKTNRDSPASSNYVQYAGNNSDVCLKISIQKTETNVVTVEEVSPQRTVHYTIEEDTSSSEFSDEPPIVPVKLKAIAGPSQVVDKQKDSLPALESKVEEEDSLPTSDPKDELTDSSPSSSQEDKSKTIFEELKMEPPVKGSVKDFVHAFNMLATKGHLANDPNGAAKNIQSFPTKWEFQNSKGFPTNQFLLPIAEESVNEISDKDGNVEEEGSPAERQKSLSHHHSQTRQQSARTSDKVTHREGSLKAAKQKPIDYSSNKPPLSAETSKSSEEKCSHCFERHAPSASLKKCSKKKRTAPRAEKTHKREQAHVTALSSLLKDNTSSDLPNGSLKLDSKLDQPIMVGLYIEDKSSHRGPMPLLVTPSMSLKKLKKQVEEEYSLPRHHQCWILGQSFAVRDEASLASYGVKEAGCPVLLYVMGSYGNSLSTRRKSKEDSSEEDEESLPKIGSIGKKKDTEKRTTRKGNPRDELESVTASKHGLKSKETNQVNNKSEFHRAWEDEYEKKADYRSLVALDDVDLVANVESFECPVCFLEVAPREGAVLQECLHSFCRQCLAGSVQYSDTAIIKCPFANEEYSCESHLQEREIKCLVTPDVYEKHLARSVALAESQARDSFHCKTPDCPGWCLFEDNVNTFLCPVCKRTNCLTCGAVHEGRNCRQYQDWLALQSDTSEEARKTREYLKDMVTSGEAMECPMCQVILMKKWGCDWLKCSMCHSEVCWVTKGPRWGPGGRGDTSGGCKCMLNGVRCHPKCSYCH